MHHQGIDSGMLLPDSLKGKVILVTGGGTGLGFSMARYFLSLGAKVAIASRKEEVLHEAAQQLSSFGEVMPLVLDVREYRQVEAVLNTLWEKWGGLDVLVNNAAGNFISPTESLSPKAFDVVVDIVLKGSYTSTLLAGQRWIKENRQGTVLSIVTTYASTGSGYVVPSACAKAGVIAMTRSLASEWGRKGIRLNAIAPGPFPTDGAWSRLFPGDLANMAAPENRIPLGRVGKHGELANLAAFLISDYSAYINGEVVTIDGGEWIKGAGEFNFLDELSPQQWAKIKEEMKR